MSATLTEPRARQIGAIAARTGVNIETMRYYERIGILPKPWRSEGGHRIYTVAQEQRLTFIRRSRELGFSLDDVRALLAVADGGNRNCAEVYDLSAGHLREVQQKIVDLKRIERVLKSMVEKCSQGTLPHCPIIETLSAPSDTGTKTRTRVAVRHT